MTNTPHSVDFCSDCRALWPKYNTQLIFKHCEPLVLSACCEASLTTLDEGTHVSWICDLGIYLLSADSYDETCEAVATFVFDSDFDYDLTHDWFGFETNLELKPCAHGNKYNNALVAWIEDTLADFELYDGDNDTSYRLKFNSESKELKIYWIL